MLGVCPRPTLRAQLSVTFLQRKDVVNQCLEFAPDPDPVRVLRTLLQWKAQPKSRGRTDKSTISKEAETKARQRSKCLQQRPHYNRSNPCHLLSVLEQVTLFRLARACRNCLNQHLLIIIMLLIIMGAWSAKPARAVTACTFFKCAWFQELMPS